MLRFGIESAGLIGPVPFASSAVRPGFHSFFSTHGVRVRAWPGPTELIDQSVALARDDGRGRGRHRVSHAAADATGFDTHHVSRYFIWRTHRTRKGKQPAKRVGYRRFGKLMVLVCCTTHLILNAEASAGPTPDIHQLAALMAHTPAGLTAR